MSRGIFLGYLLPDERCHLPTCQTYGDHCCGMRYHKLHWCCTLSKKKGKSKQQKAAGVELRSCGGLYRSAKPEWSVGDIEK